MKATKTFLIITLSMAITIGAFAREFKTCDQDPDKQRLRSAELQKIVKEDQDDRSGDFSTIDWGKVAPRDESRRKRVGEIFGEGCLKTASDYSAAALVYQHGNIPDHFFQTFIWAKRAVDLGDQTQKWLIAAGIDRYLVRMGNKQLFATQASILPNEKCWCLDPVEDTFPETRRIEFAKRGLNASFEWVKELNKDKPGCEMSSVCNIPRKASTQGTIPGFW